MQKYFKILYYFARHTNTFYFIAHLLLPNIRLFWSAGTMTPNQNSTFSVLSSSNYRIFVSNLSICKVKIIKTLHFVMILFAYSNFLH